MKTIITSRNSFYRDLHSLCEEIGKKCLNGEKVNLDEEIWNVLNNGKNKKIMFEIVYSQPFPNADENFILLVLNFDNRKWKTICINVSHTKQAYEEGYDLHTVEYSIDNVFYSTSYCNGECRTVKENFIQ